MINTVNPLAKYFRQPAIYITLPSKGKFYPVNSINIPPSGELPVFPMTAMDEIYARTPDSLFNGTSIVDVVKSCIPDIGDPWSIPSIDLNAILAAIRLASYGAEMEISTQCPACTERSDFTVDLRTVLDNIGSPNYDSPLTIGDLTFYFGPTTYKQQTEIALEQFESQKIIEVVNSMEMDDAARAEQIGKAYRRIADITVSTVTKTIRAVKTPDAMVSEYAHIRGFLDNCTKDIWVAVRDYSIDLRNQSEIKPLNITCPNCQHQYEQSFTINMSNFFEIAS